MQERDELRASKRGIKMSRERKVKEKICVWKRKEERKKRNRKRRKREREMARKI
jgi:hypothetical protein